MNNDSYKKYEPIFNSWYIKELLGEGSFGQVFKIEKKELGSTYEAALKIITIPKSSSEVKSIMADGMSREEATEYYRGIVQNIVSESILMSKLKGNSNIVSYEDHMTIEHQDDVGWDILIKMELLTPLLDYTSKNALSTHDVIDLGIDICKALELCKKNHIVHRDVKPENIFVSSNGDYKLGDFGIARTMEKTVSGMSKKGTYTYMAPEIYRGYPYGSSVDVYSLGIVLYRFLNDNRTPFLPPYPTQITYQAREHALFERIKGTEIPKPKNAPSPLASIILKACAYDPAMRYPSAKHLRIELEKVRDVIENIPLTPIKTFDKTESTYKLKKNTPPAEKETPAKLKKSIVIAGAATLIAIIIVIFAVSGGTGSDKNNVSKNPSSKMATTENIETTEETTQAPPSEMVAGDSSQVIKSINSASVGDIIYIDSGSYTFDQPLEIFQDNITIIGRGETKPVIDCGIYVHGFDVTIENISINIPSADKAVDNSTGIKLEGGGTTTLKDVNVEMVYYSELILYGLILYSNASIDRCFINVNDSDGNGNIAIGTNSEFTLTDSTLSSNDVAINGFMSVNSLTESNIEKILANNTFDAPTKILQSISY